MTDEELKQLVANLVIVQQKTSEQIAETDAYLKARSAKLDEQMARTDAQMARTDARFEKLEEQMARTDTRFEKLEAQMARTDARFEKLDEQMARTDAQMARTDARLDKVAKLVGSISNNQGDMVEEFFYRSFKRNPIINGVRFDWVERQLHNRIGEIEDEYDIVLLNGDSLALIEVKAKAHNNDLEKLANKKVANFSILFPMYKDYKKYAGLATFVTNAHLIEKAQELGLFLFTQHGKHAEVVNTGRILS
jgi:Holliday junction resolvase-like predicted endonuclease